MAKLLRGQDRLLLALSLIGDILDLTVGAGSRAYHYRKLGFYFPPGYKSFNLNNTVHRSLKTQNIEKVVNKKGQVCLQLTGLGEKQLQRNFPLLKLQQKQWDGYWRLVTFDIPEKHKGKRDLLRHKLQSLGFAQFQKSSYISPHDFCQDMIEFLNTHSLSADVFVLEVKHKYLPPPKEFAQKFWCLTQLNDQYRQLLEKFNERPLKPQLISDQYFALIIKDPHLPIELLPEPWFEPLVREKLFKSISLDSAIAS
ncbi:hypothetical protein L6272_01040 [Microgenomates group bacterium]|nr:hypothetical protein [Microgenomates group bacterium]